MWWDRRCAYSYFNAGAYLANRDRSESMFDGDYSLEMAKGKMQEAIRAHNHDALVKQVRASRKVEPPRKSIVARRTAVVMALFR
jgi:hypothetical protein